MADGQYRSADETTDKKGLWGAVTGILFGSVTLTEDADAFLHEQEHRGNNMTRRDRSGQIERARHKERDLLDANSCRKARAYIRGHYHRKELLRATLVFGQAKELLLSSGYSKSTTRGGSNEGRAINEALMAALKERTQALLSRARRERQLCKKRQGRVRG